jgi:glycosyltransferase 2 family protein
MKRGSIKRILPIIGIVILAYIVYKANPAKVAEEISKANLSFFLIAVGLTALSLATQTIKWAVIADYQGIKIKFREAFKINLIGFFYGFLTPAKIGNILRADYMRKYTNGDLSPGIANFVLDKIFDLLSLIGLVVFFSFSFKSIIPINYFYISALLFTFFIAGIFIFKDRERSKKILRVFYVHLVPSRLKERWKKRFYSFYDNFPSKRYFILFFLVNGVNWIVIYLSMYFMGLSLGINISFITFLAICPIATLIGYIPITINGLGTREVILVSLMGLFGVDSVKVVSMSLLNLLIGGIIPSITAIFLIPKMNHKADEEIKHSNPGLQ